MGEERQETKLRNRAVGGEDGNRAIPGDDEGVCVVEGGRQAR